MRIASKAGALVLTIAITFSVLAGCKASIVGKYFNEKHPNQYIELKPDLTFQMVEEDGTGATGTYEIEGDVILLKLQIGIVGRSKLQGNTLIDPDGDRWTKK